MIKKPGTPRPIFYCRHKKIIDFYFKNEYAISKKYEKVDISDTIKNNKLKV